MRKLALAALAVVAQLAVSVGAAHAVNEKPCLYAGQAYSHGAVLPNGQTCNDGTWVGQPANPG